MVNIPSPNKKKTNKLLSNAEFIQKDYYNRIAEKYDLYKMTPFSIKYRRNLYDHFFSKMNLKDLRVLDALSGGGESTNYFIRHDSIVTGLDISEECCLLY